MADISISAAFRACKSCRQRKRQCNKKLPGCSECAKKHRRCDYGAVPGQSSQFISAAEAFRRPSQSQFHVAAVSFLDTSAYIQHETRVPCSLFYGPSMKCEYLGDRHDQLAMVDEYFKTVHGWMPFVSCKRLYKLLPDYANHEMPSVPPTMTLLLYCMKLMLWEPASTTSDAEASARSPAYMDAKRLWLEAEIAGILSITVLQAGLLIALYEIGHAIYPSAYLSVGACARYGMALGIDKQGGGVAKDWVEAEEKKRVWWAIVILDRFLNLGCPERGLVTRDPDSGDALPVDDVAWDTGDEAPEVHTLSCDAEIYSGRFARLAQTANLLAQVLRHAREHGTEARHGSRETEATQLDRTLRALINLMDLEGTLRSTPPCAQRSICFSALAILNRVYALPPSSPANTSFLPSLPMAELTAPSLIASELIITAKQFMSGKLMPLNAVSPLNMHWIYWSSGYYAQQYQNTGSEEFFELQRVSRQTLEVLCHRWAAAGAYIKILDAKQVLGAF